MNLKMNLAEFRRPSVKVAVLALILGGRVDERLIGSESLSFGGGKTSGGFFFITKSYFLQVTIALFSLVGAPTKSDRSLF
ncbi:hypothetical protein [Leptospira stimsonii]|uniref:Uncharacterized protein n=1 Tax=Leptospira stimsonii TaxID=2202203 RepID=A0ABY2N4E6_9LEPT|nr:hypothetical protein [Leptospira stimsonii]TGK22998.1 hypothetical protein EHO98_06940 [Leptospira stimsonii]TGM16569.1 hypothetical protein EHQ90_09325 [Leptospira stimsonii]